MLWPSHWRVLGLEWLGELRWIFVSLLRSDPHTALLFGAFSALLRAQNFDGVASEKRRAGGRHVHGSWQFLEVWARRHMLSWAVMGACRAPLARSRPITQDSQLPSGIVSMLPPVDDAVLQQNPEFAALYAKLTLSALNSDGSSQNDSAKERRAVTEVRTRVADRFSHWAFGRHAQRTAPLTVHTAARRIPAQSSEGGSFD